KPRPLEERLEGAVLPHVAEFGPGRVEGNSARREIFWIGEQEGRLGIDESLDEPRRGQAVDVGPPAGDPLPAPELPKIPHSPLSALRLFRWSGAHGNGLPQPLDLSPRRGVEEIELVELLVLPLELRQIRLDPLTGGRGLAVKILQQLPVPSREPSELGLARLVKEADHVLWAHVLDLLDAEERGLSPLPLDLFGRPLGMFVVVWGVWQQVDGAFERDRADRTQPPPNPHAEARRIRRQAGDEKKKPRVHYVRSLKLLFHPVKLLGDSAALRHHTLTL